jgi:hypothetical protein
VDPDTHVSAFILVGWIRIQEGKNEKCITKVKKFKSEILDVLFYRDDDFSCS